MIPRTLSASSLQVWALCKARWKAEYMDRAPSFDNNAALTGTAVHAGLEQFVKAVFIDKTHAALDRVKRKELLITYYQMGYMQTFGTTDMDTPEYKDGFDLSMKWFARTPLDDCEVESVELKETIKVPYNHPDGTVHEVDFNYVMDRVDQIDATTWRVVDYKTIRVPIYHDDLRVKVQARAYALAIQIKHPEAQTIIVEFDLLRHERVSINISREENISFWRFLCSEAQEIVNTDEKGMKPTLNPECGYCVLKYSCPEMKKNIAAGGYHSLSIDDKAKMLEQLTYQKKASERIIEELENAMMEFAAKNDTLEWETEDGATLVEIGMTAARRQFDASKAADIMGPDLFSSMASMTVGNLEKIIKDESLDSEMRARLKALLVKGNGNLKAYVKPKKKVI